MTTPHVSASPCAFCSLPDARIWRQNAVALAFRDGYPVSVGHTLVIPRRHVVSIFECPPDELAALWALVGEIRTTLQQELPTSLQPDGFTIGVNDGLSAGQTILHGHIHVIPRRVGDVSDPRGGIRWVIPDKADYWSGR